MGWEYVKEFQKSFENIHILFGYPTKLGSVIR